MKKLFTDHPSTAKETYLEHGKFALIGSFRFAVSSVFFFLHAFFPFIPVPPPFDLKSTIAWLSYKVSERNGK